MKTSTSQVGGKSNGKAGKKQARNRRAKEGKRSAVRRVDWQAIRQFNDEIEMVARVAKRRAVVGPATAAVQGRAPGARYLEGLRQRQELEEQDDCISFKPLIPGLSFSEKIGPASLVEELTFALYGDCGPWREKLFPVLSAWEVVELAELLRVSALIHGAHVDGLKPKDGKWMIRQVQCGSGELAISTRRFAVHLASVLLHHARAISRLVVPALRFEVERVRLLQALALAEQFIAVASGRGDTLQVEKPSALLCAALEAHAQCVARRGDCWSTDYDRDPDVKDSRLAAASAGGSEVAL